MVETESELGVASRALRAAAHRARQVGRALRWALEPEEFPRPQVAAGLFRHRIYDEAIPLGGPAVAEEQLERGKRLNVALAAPAFDGVVVSPWRPLSFWRTLGAPAKTAGFQAGVEILGGCLVPSIGGGLCFVSNALFVMAARLGWTVIERHQHSARVGASAPGDIDLDATVLWPHLDLRVAPREGPVRLSVAVREGRLHLAADASRPTTLAVALISDPPVASGCGGAERVVERLVRDRASGRVLWREVLARDRRPAPPPAAERRRTCLTCDEQAAGRCATGASALWRIR
jgi:vancomycin resistance protein VanW